jgi:hypothetical protein
MRSFDGTKLLLLIDLNGTMCFRTETKINPSQRKANLHVRNKFIYLRGGAESFLQTCSDRFNVCILTSMVKRNADAVLNLINSEKYLVKVFDRDYHKKDPEGAESWDTIRDMDKIFLEGNGMFGFHNTVLLDNETRKIRDFLPNGILVGEYGLKEATNDQKDSLLPIQEYLLQMAAGYRKGENGFEDVRQWMEQNPLKDAEFGSKSLAGTLEAQLDDKEKTADSTFDNLFSDLSISKKNAPSAKAVKSGQTVENFLERFGSQTMTFECLKGPTLYFSNFKHGIQVSFNVSNSSEDLLISNKLTLTSLWRLVHEKSLLAKIEKNGNPIGLEGNINL